MTQVRVVLIPLDSGYTEKRTGEEVLVGFIDIEFLDGPSEKLSFWALYDSFTFHEDTPPDEFWSYMQQAIDMMQLLTLGIKT